MNRLIISAVVGAVLLFAWNFVSWVVVGLHDGTMQSVPNTDTVSEALNVNIGRSGVYFYPGLPEEATDQQQLDWTEKHRRGPIGMIVIDKDGAEPMAPMTFVWGLAINLASTILAAALLTATGIRSFVGRVLFVLTLGLFVGLVSDLNYWNWMYFPADYTIMMIVDHLVGWGLVALLMGAVIKPIGAR